MKKYSEYNRKKPFDWYTFLNKKTYTQKELDKAQDLAGSWVTCACGNQCTIIPRDEEGCPLDEVLRNLGLEFTEKLVDMDTYFKKESHSSIFELSRKDALKILDKIEKRSTLIINKTVKELEKKGFKYVGV